jgi:hypothetical protein
VSVNIAGVVRLHASSLNLLETPLRKIDVAGTEITSKILVLQAESGCEGAEPCAIVGGGVTNNLYLPVILGVSNSGVSIARYLPVGL